MWDEWRCKIGDVTFANKKINAHTRQKNYLRAKVALDLVSV